MVCEVPVDMTFCGKPMAQMWEDLLLYEKVLNAHLELAFVYEIGTYQGGLSLFLHAQCQARGMKFLTVDIISPGYEVPGFLRLDALVNVELAMRKMVHPALIICDGGNKPLEVATYAPQMQSGDILAVHDWGIEFNQEDVPSTLHPIHEEWCLGMTRVFTLLDEKWVT